MASISVGVQRKQLVDDLWTLCQKAARLLNMWDVGVKTSAL